MMHQKQPLDTVLRYCFYIVKKQYIRTIKYRKNSRSTFLEITNSNSSKIAKVKALGGDMLT